MAHAEARNFERQEPSPEELDDLIDEVEDMIDAIPLQIRDIWQKKFDDLIDNDVEDFKTWLEFKDNIGGLRDKRNSAVDKLQADFFIDEIDRYRELFVSELPFYEQREECSFLVELLEDKQNKIIGAGQVAEVFANSDHLNSCFKVVKDWRKYREGNNLLKEAYLQLRMSKFNSELIAKVPEVQYCAALDDFRVIAMDRVDGASLSELMLDIKRVPDNFEFDVFFREIQNTVDKMHSLNIHHRDLHAGNIMMDYETGLPYIIDFGLAVEAGPLFDEDEIYKQRLADGSVLRFNYDNLQLQEVKSRFKSALAGT
ncbi:MAG: phosphotransferase [Candidatus Magasanikbacteria bacterium]|nr:phosphotransferase [Candidatus Magasanikbacteria bacterium]